MDGMADLGGPAGLLGGRLRVWAAPHEQIHHVDGSLQVYATVNKQRRFRC